MSVRADVNSSEAVDPIPISEQLRSTVIGVDRGLGVVKDRPLTTRRSISALIVEEARAKFERRSGREYTEHEVREMLGTLTDVVRLLVEWDQNPVSQTPVAQCIDGVDDIGT